MHVGLRHAAGMPWFGQARRRAARRAIRERTMLALYTAVEIAAPARRVWDIVPATEACPAWNPFVPQLAGPLNTGDRFTRWVGWE
jgi:hypothetical protein